MQTGTARSTDRNLNIQIAAPNSLRLSKEIEALIPGGVNSPFRSFREVGGHTLFIERGEGSRVFDIDGNNYIDYVGAWGPAVLGHARPEIIEACSKILSKGSLFGTPHELELQLAKKVIDSIPSIEKIRFVNSGTEAVMSAIRLARGYTGKDLLIMFEGCYHGHSDATLANCDTSHSAGIPSSYSKNTVCARFNDLDSVDRLLDKHEGEVAAVIIEPVAGSMGVVAPEESFLQGLRDLCTKYGVLLIFDEVLTGFRVSYGGAQELYGVQADLTCYGKALGGGMPIGAYGGRAEIMDRLMPDGDVYQAGTFSGNPLSMAGGLAALDLLSVPGVYDELEQKSKALFELLEQSIERLRSQFEQHKPGASCSNYLGLPQLVRVGSMFAFIFAPQPVSNFEDSKSIDEIKFARFFHEMLKEGIMLPPTAVDAACISNAHQQADLERTAIAFENSMRKCLSART